MWMGVGNMTFCTHLDISFNSLQITFLEIDPLLPTHPKGLGVLFMIFFLCRSWYNMQFLAKTFLSFTPPLWGVAWQHDLLYRSRHSIYSQHKKNKYRNWPFPPIEAVDSIYDFSVQIWKFYAILSKKFLGTWNCIPILGTRNTPHHLKGHGSIHNFPVHILTFYATATKNILSLIPTSQLYGAGDWKHDVFVLVCHLMWFLAKHPLFWKLTPTHPQVLGIPYMVFLANLDISLNSLAFFLL